MRLASGTHAPAVIWSLRVLMYNNLNLAQLCTRMTCATLTNLAVRAVLLLFLRLLLTFK